MRIAVASLLLLTATFAAGCGNGNPAPAAAPAAAPAPPPLPTGPLVDGPEYANWKQFPVGTVVTRKSVTSAEGATASTTSVETLTLREVNDRELIVDRQNTTERSDGSLKTVNPSEARKFPRQFALPNGMTAEDFAKPSQKAVRSGEEAVTANGKEYEATVYTWTDSTEAGPMSVKLWMSDAMPGRIVKQVMTVAKLKATTVEEVVGLKIP